MKEFIEKLIGRLEEVKEKHQPIVNGKTTMRDLEVYKMTIGYAEEIVNQLAEEYNNGWIPCSERLPEENQRVLGCFAHGTVTEFAFYDGLFHGIYAYNTKIIIAWQPLPAPYQPKGE